MLKGQQGNQRKNIVGALSRSPTEPKTNTRDWLSTQPFSGGDYSALSQWVAGLKPHYIVSGYGFNLRPDIDWSTAPRQDFRWLNRRDMNISLKFRVFYLLKMTGSCSSDLLTWDIYLARTCRIFLIPSLWLYKILDKNDTSYLFTKSDAMEVCSEPKCDIGKWGIHGGRLRQNSWGTLGGKKCSAAFHVSTKK